MPRLRVALQGILAGLLLAVVDLRLQEVDLLPDALGYAAAAGFLAAAHGKPLHPGWRTLGVVAFAATAILSLPDAFLASKPPGFGVQAWVDPLWPLRLALGAATQVALAATLLALVPAARHAGDEEVARHARWGAGTLLALVGVGLAFAALAQALEPGDALPAGILLALVDAAAFVWAAVILWRARRIDGGAAPPPPGETWRESI